MLSGRLAQFSFCPTSPSSSASSHTGILNLCKMAHEKSKNRETECKNGSQHSRCIPNAHLTFEYLKAFFTQLFTAKVNTQKKETSKAFIENPGMQCLRCVVEREHRKPFLQFFFFFVFFRQSCTVTALSSNMHLVVLSHRCVQTI